MKRKRKVLGGHQPDYVLVIIFFILLAFGAIMLSSAGSVLSFQRFGDSFYYAKHQIMAGIIPGFIVFLITSRIHFQFWKKFSFPILCISILLLFAVFIPGIGVKIGGSQSWVNFFGLQFQPSEIVKLTFIIYLANWLSVRKDQEVKDVHLGFLPFLFMLGIIAVLMVLQPDVGTMTVIVLTALTMYYVGGAAIKHLAWIAVLGLGGLWVLIKSAPYRAARFTTFLHPELDPEGIGYHINQAFLAIGSGGLFGRGFGESRQKFQYLPEVIGDSIFAVIVEEMGFIIAGLLIFLFLVMMYRGYMIAKQMADPFGMYVATGIISWFTIQAFVNIGAMLGIFPLTGIPLPFISYGGSALTISMAAMGILVNISKHTIQCKG